MALSLTSDSLIISNVPFRLESLRLDRKSGCSVSSNLSLGSAEVETGDDVLSGPGSFSLPQLMGKMHTDLQWGGQGRFVVVVRLFFRFFCGGGGHLLLDGRLSGWTRGGVTLPSRSLVRSLTSMAASGALCPPSWRMNVRRDKSQTTAVRSREPDTRIW